MTARAPKILIADDWRDYRLLDSGNGGKLEQVGPYRFVRPEPQALWSPSRGAAEWDAADAVFAPSAADDDSGRWRFKRELPQSWPMQWSDLKFISRPTPFRHLGFFPEHSVHWRFARECLTAHNGTQPEVLNLFGYTGLASLACASVGAKVTHVDASKKAIGFAKDNQSVAGLNEAPIRWICDDALSFVKREIRRGRRYDGIIVDPPKFGRGPEGETWRLENDLLDLFDGCQTLLRTDPGERATAQGFFIATIYAVRLSYLALAQTAAQVFEGAAGEWEIGEMALAHEGRDLVLPTAIFARWRG